MIYLSIYIFYEILDLFLFLSVDLSQIIFYISQMYSMEWAGRPFMLIMKLLGQVQLTLCGSKTLYGFHHFQSTAVCASMPGCSSATAYQGR